ncbi:MAG TPA: protein kinase [Planctomycetota bacterium]|nr:protein kinase [Planctomycetota bacterium]
MPPHIPSPDSDEHAAREHVQSLLDFVLMCESDAASGSLRPLEEYQRLFPRIADAVAREYTLLTSTEVPAFEDPAAPKPRIAHYVLERELGSGGQGRVFLATDSRMRRQVALKVLTRAQLTPDKLRRFRREVEVIAQLDHPGLCTVYEADLDAPRPYLAMRFVDGEDLSRKLSRARATVDRSGMVWPHSSTALAQLLHVFERTARALHAAHEAGVVHRDIKPANILLSAKDEPVIVDFGLARDDDSELAGLTRTDDVLGTPAYMAPELLESGHFSVDRRVDVYALGVALYECLTLERPFRAEHREALFQSILRGDYQNPRELNAIVSEDLRVVLAASMEHQLSRRYATALEFAEDLRRVREYEPIRARRAGWMLRARRWSQRHPRIAAAAALLLVALCAWIGTLNYTLDRVEAQSQRARVANARLLGVECRERSAAQLATDPGLALVLAIEADRRDPGFESNMAVQNALLRRNEERTFWVEGARVCGDIDVSSDGRKLVVPTSGYRGYLYDFDSGHVKVRSERVCAASTSKPVLTGFSPDGRSFFVSDETDAIGLYDSETGRFLRSFGGHRKAVTSCRFSPDGLRLLTSSFDGRMRLFDVESATLEQSFGTPSCYFTLAQFDASGSLVLTTKNARADAPEDGPDYDPRIWDARSGALLATLRGHASPIRGARFSKHDDLLVTVGSDGILRCWDWRKPLKERWRVALPGEAWCISLSPDDTRVAVGFTSGAQVIDMQSGATAFDLGGPFERSVVAIAFSPDGRWIAAADYGGNLGAWQAHDGVRRFRTCAPSENVKVLSWLPDSRRFISGGGGSHVRLWTMDPLPYFVAWKAHAGAVNSAMFDSGSRSVLSAGEDGIALVSDASDGAVLSKIEAGLGPLARAWFVDGGRRVACLARSGAFSTFDLANRSQRELRVPDGGSVMTSAISNGHDSLCLGLSDGRVLWIETDSGRLIASADRIGSSINAVAISPQGERAAWGSSDGWAGLLDRSPALDPSFDECRSALYLGEVFMLAFTVQGRRLLTCGDHGGAHEWDASTGAFLRQSNNRPMGRVALLHGGMDLVASIREAPQLLRLDGESLELRWGITQPSTDLRITSLRVSENNEFALSATRGGVAQITKVADGDRVLRYEHGSSPLTCAEFSPDGRIVVTAAEDGSLRVWPVDVAAVARQNTPSTPEMWPGQIPSEVEDL